MKKKSLRVLSLIVAIVMAISILPLAALAEEANIGVDKRRVGVVVYGSEFTKLLQSSKDLDLESFVSTLQDIATKTVDGTGVSVPEVDISMTYSDGQIYKLKQDPNINVLAETMQTTIPFEGILNDVKNNIESDLEAFKDSLNNAPLLATSFEVMEGVIKDLMKTTNDATDVANRMTAALGTLATLNPTLYRTYVTDAAIPTGRYKVKVEGFVDVDKDNNPITREGYILYNDGLEASGSGFNTDREFYVDVVKQEESITNLTNKETIQFIGPANGISGEIPGVELLRPLYEATQQGLVKAQKELDNVKGIIKTLVETAEGLDPTSWFAPDGKGLSSIAINYVTSKIPGYSFIAGWKVPQLTSELKTTYALKFPGLWCAEVDAGFEFTNVDVADTGLAGSNFLLVNRDETVDILKVMVDLSKEVFSAALKATFGYTDEESGEKQEGMLKLYTQLIKSEDGSINLDYDVAYDIVKTYIGVIAGLDILDKIVETDVAFELPSIIGESNIQIPSIKLAHPLPAMLKAESASNGRVQFNKSNNVTLTWMIDVVDQIVDRLGESIKGKNELVDLLLSVSELSKNTTVTVADDFMNTIVYPFAQRLGLVGKKMGSGTYVMFQIKAADDYWVNPLAYTMILTWENDTWLYVTVADLGIIVPYFAEGFYDFVRNTTFAGTIDKFLNQLAGKDVNVISRILTNELDITEAAQAEMNRVVTGALTAFVGTVGFNSLGADSLYASRMDFINGINQYLYDNGRTAQNLMIYLNKQAQRAKSVYTGYVDKDWYFYNLDKSPTLTATKLINKSTENIAAAFVNKQKASAVTAIGNNVSKVVNNIGTKVEQTVQNVKTQIKSTIGAAVKNVIKNIGTTIKNTVTNVFKNLFSRSPVPQ